MREVAVVGVGMVPFVRRSDTPSADLGAGALRGALDDAGLCWTDIDRVVVGALGAGLAGAPSLLRRFPRIGTPAYLVENASATGSTALAAACEAVAGGHCDVAAAVGFGSLEAALATMAGAGSPSLSSISGANLPPVVFGLVQSRRMHLYGEGPEASARVAVKNHANACRNPNAQRHKQLTLEDVLGSPIVADPIRRLECCPLGDGGAAAIVAPADLLATPRSVPVRASVSISDRWHAAGAFAPDPTATQRAATQAMERAAVAASDLDVVEVHDAFAVEELEYAEALGLCPPGEAGAAIAAGDFDVGGRVAVSPSGGLLARGHPGGATGLAQVVEIVQQLRGEAGGRQQPDAAVGLAHMIGAGGVCVVHVFGT